MVQPPLIFVDTETNGLRYDARPWEVAAIVRDPDGSEARYRWFIADFAPADADPSALELGRYYQRHPYAAVEDTSMQADLSTFLEDANLPDPDLPLQSSIQTEATLSLLFERLSRARVLVACNPTYDAGVLTRMLTRRGLAPTWHYRTLCATTEAAGYLRGQGTDVGSPPYNNDRIGQLLGVDRDQFGTAHTAIADAYYARALYDAVHTVPAPSLP